MDFKGIITAIVTPLTVDFKVDEKKLKNLIEFQIKNKVHGLLVLGGTGEYSALTMQERKRAVEITVKTVGGRVPVMVGVLEPGIGECLEFCRFSKQAGADSLLILTPFYVHPTQNGILEFYQAVDKEIDMPILIYNIPYRTSVNALPETIEEIVNNTKHVVGIKECSPNLSQFIELVNRVGDKIAVLSGEEFLVVSEMAYGAKGGILATANLVPGFWIKIYNDIMSRNSAKATKDFSDHYELFKTLFSEVNPGPLKYAMNKVGIDVGEISIPLCEPTEVTKKNIEECIKKFNIQV